jgi:hypothetical protein
VCSLRFCICGVRLQVARQADLERDAAVGDVLTQLAHVPLAVLDLGSEMASRLEQVGAMADAIGVQIGDGLEDALRAVGLAGVHGLLEEVLLGVAEGFGVIHGRVAGLFTRQVETDDGQAVFVARDDRRPGELERGVAKDLFGGRSGARRRGW